MEEPALRALKKKDRWAPRNPKSAISGEGYGASHNWKYITTTAGRCSLYKCADCGRHFSHHYPSTPGIHEAIFKYTGGDSQIPDVCPSSSEGEARGEPQASPAWKEKETAHTPGPWELDEETYGRVFAPSGCVLAVVDGVWDYETEKANCRLIAAAPELLAVAQSLVRNERQINDEHFSGVQKRLMDMARAAISKATSSSKPAKQAAPPTSMEIEK